MKDGLIVTMGDKMLTYQDQNYHEGWADFDNGG